MSEERRPRYKPLPDPRVGTVHKTETGLTISVPDPSEVQETGSFTLSQDHSAPAFQRDAITAQLERLTESRRDQQAFWREAAGSTYGEVISTGAPGPDRLQGIDAHYLLVSIGAVLRNMESLLQRTGDERLREARDEFNDAFPDAKDLRDIAEHLEAYAIGEGWMQRETVPADRRVRSDSPTFWMLYEERSDPHTPTWIYFSDSRRVELKAAAAMAISITEMMEQVENEYAERHGKGPWA